ncbi:MAG: GNAT family N-acetyltransferase [Anaerolineales bacterium]
MLSDEKVRLRLIRQEDLELLHEFHQDISNRGAHFPTGVLAEPIFRQKYQQSGFWSEDQGMLLIMADQDELAGHIEFFRTVSYLDELELSYHIYQKEHRGRGLATKSVELLTDYLFKKKRINRIRLVIHPDNIASKKVAERCGYNLESVSRGAWYHQGRHHDVEIYSKLQAEHLDG